MSNALARFDVGTRRWFEGAFETPTPVQERGWESIASGRHALLVAPTGSGKTLAAFLWCIDNLYRRPLEERRGGVRVLYVSPLKALAYDVERNLRAPLIGIGKAARGLDAGRVPPRVAIRSGDTTQKERRLHAKEPPEIFVTTPESLYLVLGSQAREGFRTVETVIVDEVHALAPAKRGAHLALTLERLATLSEREPQRIGLSATARPLELVARYLGGDRPVDVVDCSDPPLLDLRVMVPVLDMTHPERLRAEPPPRAGALGAGSAGDGEDEADDADASALDEHDEDAGPRHGDPALTRADEPRPEDEEPTLGLGAEGAPPQHGIWPVIVPELVRLIREHRTTIVFVNSRGLCERLVQHINELAEEPLVRAHHGSLAQQHRREVEDMLKSGRIAGIVATSSLELGIDMGAVDLVVLVESPGSVARGLQRVGRAGHGVGEVSKGRVFPKHRHDLLEATVVAERMRKGELEPLGLPRNPLDVLAQQIVAMVGVEPWRVGDVERLARRTASFAELPHDAFVAVLDMLSGRYPSTDFSELRPRLVWDREDDTLSARAGARMLAVVSGGTIPDRGLYAVYLGVDGKRVGELDEEMVHETQPGQVITLGASSWRVEEITRDRVIVAPAPGEVGRMPFWRGEGPGRPIELGVAMGAFLRVIGELPEAAAAARLEADYHLTPLASENLLRYLREQQLATFALPTDETLVVERFRDELGDHRVCILSPFGARVHAPWGLALQHRLAASTGFEAQCMWSDDGICLRIADADEELALSTLFPEPDEVEEMVVAELGDSPLFASHFRENAARALLLPRRRPGSRTPLWQQRLKSQQLLAVAKAFPAFPIVVETYRECLQDVFDLPALRGLLARVRSRAVKVHEVTTSQASPFASSLVFAFVAAFLYEGDAPVAERRAQALALDRNLLRELLGSDELRELLDDEVIAELERELQLLTEERQARGVDAAHDVLRRLGALSPRELSERSASDPAPWIAELVAARRAVMMGVGGEPRLCAVEDAALYRDALGSVIPHGVPVAYLDEATAPLEGLLTRYARTHGPFTLAAFAARHGLSVAAVVPVACQLEGEGKLTRGAFLPHGGGSEWCDVEVLRRIKQRTLAKLRGQVEPVDKATFARFLPAWHGLVSPRKGLARLEEALVQLEGMPLSYAELERSFLPARVSDFQPRMLDELGASGHLVWVGQGALGPRDGRVALFRRERVGRLLEPPVAVSLSPLAEGMLAVLRARGACFFGELCGSDAESAPHDALVEALWDLVWAGLVTNDTFAPLRALALRRGQSRRRGRSDLRTAGRWSLVEQLSSGAITPTERAHARALMLLERHGVVSREAVSLESLGGGFSAVYPVLRSMEEAGKVRRGYFVEGIGAQFAYVGAVDRLRAMRDAAQGPQVVILSAADPANPYGWVLPWPELAEGASRQPKRSAGALLLLVDGAPTLFMERGGKVLSTFAGVERGALERGLTALVLRVATHDKKLVRIETIDGEPALGSRHAALLKELGLTFDHRGLIIERVV